MNILDLCCGTGVAARGIHQVFPNAKIIGVDLYPHPSFPYWFVQGDAVTYPLNGFDFIWASPPCQHWVTCAKRETHPDLIKPLRKRLMQSGIPYVIENVRTSPLKHDLYLVGPMVGLPNLWRERRFECSFYVKQPPLPHKTKKVYGHQEYHKGIRYDPSKHYMTVGIWHPRAADKEYIYKEMCKAMGTEDIPIKEMEEGIPPAFSAYIMQQFKTHSHTKKILLDQCVK